MNKKQLFDLYQRLNFEAQAELYENFFRLLAGDSENKESKVNINSYELIVREVIGDQSNSWPDILQSMRK